MFKLKCKLMFKKFGRTHADVVIVGGGLSGITAAYTILSLDPGLCVYILEASEELGGRYKPIQLNTCKGVKNFDFNDEFISEDQYHICSICKKLELNLLEKTFKGKAIMEVVPGKINYFTGDIVNTGSPLETYELINFLGKFEEVISKVCLLNPTNIVNYEDLDEMSMETYLCLNLRHKRNRKLLRNLIKINTGLESSMISTLFYAAFCNSTSGIHNQCHVWTSKQLMFKDGSSEIVKRILQTFGEVYINTGDPVVLVRSGRDDIVIKTELDNAYNTRYVIIAVSPEKVLQLNFEPSLSATRTKALQNLIQTKCIKFVVTYETAFWNEKGLSGEVFCVSGPDVGPFSICQDITVDNIPALCGHIYNSKEDDHNRDKVLAQLARYFGKEALSPLDYKEFFVAVGANCYPSLNAMRGYSEIRKPVGRIFWSGTETATCWYGFMSGAVQTGYRAGIEVLYDLRPQSLKVSDISAVHPKLKKRFTNYQNSPINKYRDWKTYAPYVVVATIVFLLRKKIVRLAFYIRNKIDK